MTTSKTSVYEMISGVRDLQPLPPSINQLVSVLSNDDFNISEVVKIVSLDPVLTGKMLRYANSAASAPSQTTASLQDAIMRMGSGTLLNVAMSSAVQSTMNQAFPLFDIVEGDLWCHSVCTSFAAETARRYCNTKPTQTASTAALLHDIGKLILYRFVDSSIHADLKRYQNDFGLSIQDAETQVFGIHHGDLGGLVAEYWRLPISICYGIRFHHDPAQAPDEASQQIANIICVAESAAVCVGEGLESEPPSGEESYDARERLGISEIEFLAICKRTQERMEDILTAYA